VSGASHRAVVRALLACVALAPLVATARAQGIGAARSFSVIQLFNGTNVVDLVGDGRRGQVVVSRRAADGGYDTALFQVRAYADPRDTTSAVEWQLLPFFGPEEPVAGQDLVRTTASGGCTTTDIRAVRAAPRQPVQVIVARRAIGALPAEPTVVRFVVYELRTNDEGTPGLPHFFFQRVREVRSRDRHCDVNEAFARELNLGTTGLGGREPPSAVPPS
jgi:hypothetical protein